MMASSYFEQFASPSIVGVPLIVVALMIPWTLAPAASRKWLKSRFEGTQKWLLKQLVSQLFSTLNSEARKWALLFTSLAGFLLGLNLLGLLPYTFTPTTQLSLNMAFAVPFWLAAVIIGLLNRPTHALGHLLPEGTPTLLIPMLIIIETISLLIRPIALGVRLTANLTAGHLLIELISTATFVLLPLMPAVSFLTGGVLFLLTILEVAVAMIQAYVFVLLLSLYLEENT
uniref:ATP synthase subunit a n=1 Tax=Callionymus enneactis TaxID=1147745 RepID=A0A060NSQ8_9TELE|nr:ATP synthase F0 subunit 6 [Callionymus enneactis]BAO84802.1 ATPase subunit 6 [Callionymus enneactis]